MRGIVPWIDSPTLASIWEGEQGRAFPQDFPLYFEKYIFGDIFSEKYLFFGMFIGQTEKR